MISASHIRLPDGRIVTPSTDREVLLDVLEDALCGHCELPLEQLKALARWALSERDSEEVSNH